MANLLKGVSISHVNHKLLVMTKRGGKTFKSPSSYVPLSVFHCFLTSGNNKNTLFVNLIYSSHILLIEFQCVMKQVIIRYNQSYSCCVHALKFLVG